MTASAAPNTSHGASTIRSLPVIRLAPDLLMLSRSVHLVVVRAR